MSTYSSDRKLKGLIKEGVREALGEELAKLRALALPEISKKEQKDIEGRYGRPSKKKTRSYHLNI